MADSDATSSLSDGTASCIKAAISSTPPRPDVDAQGEDKLEGQDHLALAHSNVPAKDAPGDFHALRRRERLATLSAHGDDLVSTARLADALARQYEESRNLADLERSIEIYEAFLFLIPAPHSPLYAETMCGFGLASNHEFELPEAPSNVAACSKDHQGSLNSTHQYDTRIIKITSTLAHRYQWKATHTEAPEDIGMSIRALMQLLKITSPAPEDSHRHHHLRALADLCRAYLLDEKLTGNDLERGIQSHEHALTRTPTTPNFQSDRFNLLRQLLLLHQKRFKSTGDTNDLDICLQRGSEALELMEGAEDQRPLFEDLGDIYYSKYVASRAIQDLDLAIDCCQKALRLVPHGYAHHSWVHAAVLMRLEERFRATKKISDLDTWVDSCEQALNEAHHKVKPHLLHLYASALKARYLTLGADADVIACINFCNEALATIPPEDPTQRIYIIIILSSAYLERFARTDAEQDIEAALRLWHEACDSSLPLELDLTGSSVLGEIYFSKYLSTGSEADFEAAIQHLKSDSSRTDGGSDKRVHVLADLYYEKFRKTNQLSQLDTAISILRDHLSTSRERLHQSPQCQTTLSILLIFRYLATSSREDIDESIQQAQVYLEIVHGNSREYSEGLFHLGAAYAIRYRWTNDPEDMRMAVRNQLNAFHHGMVEVGAKFMAGDFLCQLFSVADNWRAAFDQAAQTMSLVPTLTPWSLSVSDKRQQLLLLNSDFASSTAAIALLAAEPTHEAIKMLELGRGVIVGAVANMRSEISDLRLHGTSLAGEFLCLRQQLESSAGQNERYRKAREFDALLSRVRGQAGLEDFLHAPVEEEIKAAAAAGPIVIINATKWRCDALIITEGLIECLPLTRVVYAGVERRAAMPPSSLALGDLEWLWETVAEPILLHLGFTQRVDSGPWPRIWWILTGPLTNFPIHAAGRYSGVDLSLDTVLDRVISSYATSIKTLIHARRGSANPLQDGAKAVLLGIPATPGMTRLPFVKQEVAEVSKSCAALQLDVVHPQPRHEDVLTALRDNCQIFHFAGHGRNHALNPMKSALVLSDDPPLTVADLFDLNLQVQRPYLAFLAACSTSQIRDKQSLDEGLHLAIACQLAGFQHAVGSLWDVKDDVCISVAKLLYEWLVNHGMGRGSVAEGLHHASRQLRDRWFDESSFRGKCRRRVSGGREGLKRESVSETACNASKSVTGECSTRAVVLADDDPELLSLFWAPYVHFGI